MVDSKQLFDDFLKTYQLLNSKNSEIKTDIKTDIKPTQNSKSLETTKDSKSYKIYTQRAQLEALSRAKNISLLDDKKKKKTMAELKKELNL